MLSELRGLGPGGKGVVFPARTIPLHAMIFGYGHDIVRSPSYSWHGLKRGNNEFAIFQLTLSGAGMLDYEGRTLEVPPGHAMVLHVPHDHCYYFPKNGVEWEFMYLSLNGRDCVRIIKEIEKRNGPVVRLDENSRTLKVIYDIFSRGPDTPLDSPFKVSEAAYAALMGLLEDTGASQSGNERPELAKEIGAYCLENMDRNIDVDDMAEASGYSRYHFSRIFKSATGVSPAAFLNDLRMKHAIRMLQTEKMSVKEIAMRCGFQDTSYFCKVFRKNYSVSPKEFRKGG